MRTFKTPPASEENANISLDENQDGSDNSKATSESSGTKAKRPFPYNGGIFSEAARRQKAAQIGKAIESIMGNDKKLSLAY